MFDRHAHVLLQALHTAAEHGSGDDAVLWLHPSAPSRNALDAARAAELDAAAPDVTRYGYDAGDDGVVSILPRATLRAMLRAIAPLPPSIAQVLARPCRTGFVPVVVVRGDVQPGRESLLATTFAAPTCTPPAAKA